MVLWTNKQTNKQTNKESATFLDDAYTFLLQGDIQNGMDTLNNALTARRIASTIDEWRDFVTSQALTHPIKKLLHLCPFSHRAFYKPRGYAGDAVLMDFMYGEGAAKDLQLKGMALAISHYALNVPIVRANRYRRQLLAQRIDEAAMNEKKPVVLSIAAGHLREMELSQAVRNGQVGRIYALDQDTESVVLVQREYSRYNVSASVGSVRQLLNGKIKFADLSLAYAAGLFDYLADRTAQRLIEVMFSFLKSGGRILVANLVPNLPCIGYMESYMDWYLIYRSSEELLKLFETLPKDKVADLIVSFDPDDNMVFVEAVKR